MFPVCFVLPEDLELHASVLTLILTLLLTPSGATGCHRPQQPTGRARLQHSWLFKLLRRGLLDPNYCDPYPSHKSGTQVREGKTMKDMKEKFQITIAGFKSIVWREWL